MTSPLADSATRSRLVTWQDPRPYIQAIREMPGLDFLNAIKDGRFPRPPFGQMLDIEPIEVLPGRVIFSMDPDEYHFNPMGTVHGGVLATLLDSAMGCAVQSLLPAGVGFTTLEIKVNYLKAILPDRGKIFAEGTIVHSGRSSAVAEGRVFDGAGTRYAIASTTCAILRPEPRAA